MIADAARVKDSLVSVLVQLRVGTEDYYGMLRKTMNDEEYLCVIQEAGCISCFNSVCVIYVALLSVLRCV